MAPRCSGTHMPWAISSPLASQSAVEKSMLCLTTNERAVRTTVTAMLSEIPARAFLMSSKASGSRRVASCTVSLLLPAGLDSAYVNADVVPGVQRGQTARWNDGGGIVFFDDQRPLGHT